MLKSAAAVIRTRVIMAIDALMPSKNRLKVRV